jgi:cytochrome c oxidase subunit 2
MDFLIPEQASTFAPRVDLLFYFLTAMTTVLTVGIFFALIVIAVKFRRVEGQERLSKPLHSLALEITWTVIPTIVCIGIFGWATWLYAEYMNEPEGGLEIDVVGKQWMWKVQHPNGVREVNSLHVPVGRPISLTLASQDVLHDFAIPAFRVKQDVIPGRFTKLWFEATKTGTYHLFCAEYCGTEHSKMIGTVTVLEEDEYAEWLQGGPKKSPIEAGEFLFTQRGCITCHSDNSDARCPDLAGSFGESVLLKGGTEVVRDEEYLRESIMEPGKRIVDGYSPLMPSFQNQLTDEDVMNLVAYIKSLEKE